MHAHRVIESPEIGKTYTCVYNDTPLYDAVVEKAEGCWATIRVVRSQPGKHEKHYKAGLALEIKIQLYDFIETN